MEDCIFCKIVKGEANSWKVYENETSHHAATKRCEDKIIEFEQRILEYPLIPRPA